MAIQGLRTTDNFVADARPKNWREGILMRYPNGDMPLTALTSKMKSRSVDDPEFNWWDMELQTRQVDLGANLTTSNTVVSVTSGAHGFKEGDLLRVNQTGEILRVMQDPSNDTNLVVKRAFAGSVSATAVDYDGAGIDPRLTCIGSAYEEGSAAPTGVNFDPSKHYNYTQIFRNTLEATNTALETRLRTGDQAREAKRQCLEYHGIDMERAFWLGQRKETTYNGKPLRTMAGLLSWIHADNQVTADTSTGVDFATLEGYMERMFRYGPNEKLAFCGNDSLLTIQRIVRYAHGVQWNLQPDKEFGMDVTRLTCPFGSLVLKTHPLFNQMRGGANGGTAYYGASSWMVVLSMEDIKYVYLKNRDTKYQKDLTDKGVDGMKSGYLTECSLEVHHPQNHFWIKNLALAKAEA